MPEIEFPPYLYHYTSLDVLKLILENNIIRLNRLDHMNDLEEGRYSAIGNISKMIFVSCWNGTPQETVAMWKMYGDDYKGIRLRLPPVFFKLHTLPHMKTGKPIAYSFFPIKENIEAAKYFMILPDLRIPLYKIEYVDNVKAIAKDYIKLSDSESFFDSQKIATHKSKAWEIESEWRLKFIILPGPILTNGGKINPLLPVHLGAEPDIDFVDVDIEWNNISEVEITKGPCMNKNDESKLHSLLNENVSKSSFSVKNSCLKGKIKF